MKDLEEAITLLAQMDVHFYCQHESPQGHQKVGLTPNELIRYAKDPVAFLAQRYGVTKGQYLAWHESGYTVRCAGKTKSGKQCRQAVTQGMNVDPLTWVQMQGACCRVH